MKKTLIALAALAATGAAFAQSTVTISGVVDFAAASNSKVTTQVGAAAPTVVKTNSTGTQNTWTTGQVVITGTEDLGGGLRASFTINSGIAPGAGLGDRDTNLALAGNFGTVRIGRFVPAAAVGYHALSGAASTAVGSLYGMTTGTGLRFGNAAAGNMERNSNQIQYTSPNFSGFTVNVNYGVNSSDNNTVAGKNKTTQYGVHLGYANGPLSAGVGINNREVNVEDAVPGNDTIDGDLNWIGAAYDFGVARVFATHVTRDDTTTTGAGLVTRNNDSKVTSIGVSVPMDAFTFGASVYRGKNGVTIADTDNLKHSGYQLSVRYALSKRTTVYGLVGKADVKLAAGNTTGTSRKESGAMIGLLHTF